MDGNPEHITQGWDFYADRAYLFVTGMAVIAATIWLLCRKWPEVDPPIE